MNQTARFDVAIIGGGIVGLATAMALLRKYRLRLVVLEAEDRLGAHQTGNNSGVIHSGLYYKPGSLKAKLCTTGRQEMYRFCAEHGVPHQRCGKVVVATHHTEIPALEELQRRGCANGLTGLRPLSAEQIQEYEPHLRGIAALWVPDTGIVDFAGVVAAMAQIISQGGGEVCTAAPLTCLRVAQTEIVLQTPRGQVHCQGLINCAGLHCDRVARMCAIDPGVKIVPFRGEYYKLVPAKHHLVRNLIYPVPDPRFPFLGVHFTRMIKGGVEAGPNAVLALARHGYNWSSFSLSDTFETLMYPGFWRMAGKYWGVALAEVHRSLSKKAFTAALARLIPEVRCQDLQPGGAGVRAQAVDETGKLLDDFHILTRPRMVHVLNAPSPAATASISIGRHIAALAQGPLQLRQLRGALA